MYRAIWNVRRILTILTFVLCTFTAFVIYHNKYVGLQNRVYREVVLNQYRFLDYCSCNHNRKIIFQDDKLKSTCSHFADFRGSDQKVVSFSFYGNFSTKYFKGVEINAKSVAEFYPGWVMRIYHNIDRKNEVKTAALCDILCKYPHVDDCHVDSLPHPLGSVGHILGSMWRFMVLGDPTVKVFISRDLDAVMGQREVDAVNQWLDSNYTWHIMRDHSSHVEPILAGMWGVKNGEDLTMMTDLRETTLKQPRLYHKQYDQDILRDIVWPVARKDTLTHDSYGCERYNGTSPYPSRRVDGFYIGNYEGAKYFKKCPLKCRPLEHRDWENC